MRVAIFTTNPPDLYSGGRYLSLIMAYSLARVGVDVTYVSNNLPMFDGDFEYYNDQFPVRKVISKDFTLPADLTADWVIVIPTGSFDETFYGVALASAKQWKARLALLSFETPNWFNSLAPNKISPMPTEAWRRVVANGGLVISIAKEGIDYAKAYYGAPPERKDLHFAYWHPPINDEASRAITPFAGHKRRIVSFVRTEDRHKGALDLLALDPEILDGHILSLVFGRGVNQDYVHALQRHFATAKDGAIEIHSKISDIRKFELLDSAKLLLFPSYFEGFGYPPVEAAWMGVPTIAYDLPLLRESVGAAATYVPVGDTKAFSDAVKVALSGDGPGEHVKRLLRIDPDTQSAGLKLMHMLEGSARSIPAYKEAPLVGKANSARAALSDPTLMSRLDAARGQVILSHLEAELKGGRITVTGRARGCTRHDRIRTELESGLITDVRLRDDDGQGVAFSVPFAVDKLGQGQDLSCRVKVLRQGGIVEKTVTLPITLHWTSLFERQVWEATTMGKSYRDQVFIVASADTLRTTPEVSMALSEISEAVSKSGQSSTLWIQAPIDPDLTPHDMDILPRVDKLEIWHDPAPMQAIIDQALDTGQTVIIAEANLNGRTELEALALTLRSHDLKIRVFGSDIVGSAGKKSRSITYHSDPKNYRHTLRKAARSKIVVVGGIGEDSFNFDDLNVVLTRLEPHLGYFRVLVKSSWWQVHKQASLSFGRFGVIEALNDEHLLKECLQGAAIVGLDLSKHGEDIALSDIIALTSTGLTLGWRELSLETAPHLSILAKFQSSRDDGLLGEMVALLLANKAKSDVTVSEWKSLATSADSVAAEISGNNQSTTSIVLSSGAVLSFQYPCLDAEKTLVNGWESLTSEGCALKDEPALLSFGMSPKPATEQNIELLLRYAGDTDPDLHYYISLNGEVIGQVKVNWQGVKTHRFRVQPSVWKGRGAEALVIVKRKAAKSELNGKLSLVALSILPLPLEAIDWSAIEPDAVGEAPVFNEAESITNGLVRLNIGSAGATHILGRGWSNSEDSGTWTDGYGAAVRFTKIANDKGPVVLTLTGRAYVPDNYDGQRINIACGDTNLADVVFSNEVISETKIAIGCSVLDEGFDHFVLDLPDAISPMEHGAHSDSRRLSYHISNLYVNLCDQGSNEAKRVATYSGHYAFTITGQSGILRINGKGPCPKTRFSLRGSGVFVTPHLSEMDHWQANLYVSASASKTIIIDMLLADDQRPTLSGLTFWPDQVPDQSVMDEGPPVTVYFDEKSDQADLRLFKYTPVGDILRDLCAIQEFPVSWTLGLMGKSNSLLSSGWALPEESGVWSEGNVARFRSEKAFGFEPLILSIHMGAFVCPEHSLQRIKIESCGRPVAAMRIGESDFRTYDLVMWPSEKSGNELLFSLPDAISPHSLGLFPDLRQLGVWLSSITVKDMASLSTVDTVAQITKPKSHNYRVNTIGQDDRGLVIEISSDGLMPYGLSIGNGVVANPVATDSGWSAYLFVPNEVVKEGTMKVSFHEDVLSESESLSQSNQEFTVKFL